MSKEEDVYARAIVTVTLEIPIPGGDWGAECTIAQVHKQALDSFDGILHRAVYGNEAVNQKPSLPKGTRILGKPKVQKIITVRAQ